MKAAKDRTQYDIHDLADQPKGQYLARFTSPQGRETVLWVDSVVADDVEVTAYRQGRDDVEMIASFGADHTWFLIHRDLVELGTTEEFQQRAVDDLLARQQDYEAAKKRFDYLQQPKPQPRPWDDEPEGWR